MIIFIIIIITYLITLLSFYIAQFLKVCNFAASASRKQTYVFVMHY